MQKLTLEDKKSSFYLQNTHVHTRHIQIYNRTHMYTQDINKYTIKFHQEQLGEKYLKSLCRRVTIKKKRKRGDFPGGPVVVNLPCKAGVSGLIPDGELGSHMPQSN